MAASHVNVYSIYNTLTWLAAINYHYMNSYSNGNALVVVAQVKGKRTERTELFLKYPATLLLAFK
jgi:hypothetical protein